MLNEIFESLNNFLTQNAVFAVFGAFVWGILSILLSPCHLASIPLIFGYINRQSIQKAGSAFVTAFVFSLGILVTIALIGIVTSAMGRLMGDIGSTGNYLVAGIFFLAGLYLLGVINPSWNWFGLNRVKGNGFGMAFSLGLMFGLALGPCTFAFMAPVMGIAFHYSSVNLILSIALIASFGAGHCIVIAGSAAAGSRIAGYLNFAENSKGISTAKKVCGVLVMLGGLYFIYLTF